jgi:uncharacterized repeat protein (TIGR01451 family)
MKPIIRTMLLLVLISCSTKSIYAQLSDLHYLPPLKQRSTAFVDQLIYLSTPETTAFTVTAYRGTSTTPLTTFTISKSSGATYNPGSGDNDLTLLTEAKTGYVQSNAGLRFEAADGHKFYVNWRGRSASQASSLTSKGRAALGTAFKWVGAPNRGTNAAMLSNSLGIMATEDNTTVTIFGYDPNCTFRLGTTEVGITDDVITISLNKGQTYVLEAPVSTTSNYNRNGWIGASITSNKAIAVNFGQMHFQPRTVNSQDCGIDQIIPENTLGKEYIFVRANGTDSLEVPVIIATQNDTRIYVNGSNTPIATLNNGDYFEIPSTNYSQSSPSGNVAGGNLYIRTSKEAYAIQSIGGASNEATADINFIAPVNCLLANKMDYIPTVNNIAGQSISGGITIIASALIDDANITVISNGSAVATSTLTAAKKTVAGTSDWKTYYLAGLTGDVSVSANGPIAVGYFGYSGVIGASGYFSGFETIPTIEVQRIGDGCLPSTILSATPGFTAYTWYRDGELVPGIKTNSYAPDKAGKFTVTVSNGSCSYTSANQYIYDCNPEIIVNTTADKNGILAGETVKFQVSVRYLSDVNVTNLILTNLVPSNVTVTGTSATYGSVSNSGSTYTWNIGTMRNGEEHLLTITAVGNTVSSPTAGTLTVSKTQTFALGTEANKVADDFSETVTVYSALAAEPSAHPTGLYFTNTGSAHPYNNVLNFTASATADGYLVVRKTGTEPTFVPVDGTSYSTGPNGGNEIVYVGSLTRVTDMLASPATDYHYAIYPYKGGGAATNYLTINPVKAVINNRVADNFAMATSTKSSSAGLADEGVNVTFVDGVVSGGTTITAEKFKDVRPVNFTRGLPSGLQSVKKVYYTVTSSAANPGNYVIVLDFSELNMTEAEWDAARVLKRSNSSAAWEEITSKVIDRKTDGLLGKLVITGLSSFSDFAIGSTESTLPVTWLDFTAKLQAGVVALEWKTATEQHTKDFVIQHSANGIDWSEAGTVAAAGNSTTVRSYRFVHSTPVAGANYYRLLQRDLDGHSSYSIVKMLSLSGSGARSVILGNPVENGLLELSIGENARVSLKSMDGRTLYVKQLNKGKHQINVQHLSTGTYVLQINQEVMKVMIKK